MITNSAKAFSYRFEKKNIPIIILLYPYETQISMTLYLFLELLEHIVVGEMFARQVIRRYPILALRRDRTAFLRNSVSCK